MAVSESELRNEALTLANQANTTVIATLDDLQGAADFTNNLSNLSKQVEAFWKDLKVATDKAHKDVVAREKDMLNPIKEADAIIRQKMVDYAVEDMNAQREKAATINADSEQALKDKLAEIGQAAIDGDMDKVAILNAEAEIIRSNIALNSTITPPKVDGISFTHDSKITITDVSKIPMEINGVPLFIPDIKAIEKLVKASNGAIQIPGVTVEDTFTVRTIAKKGA